MKRKSPSSFVGPFLLLLPFLLSSVVVCSGPQPYGVPKYDRALSVEPAYGGLVGAVFGGSLDNYITSRLTRIPGSMGLFTKFPVPDDDWVWVENFMRRCAERGMICIVTIEPQDGLDAVTEEATFMLAQKIVRWEKHAAGAKVILRFAHEMNGGWYPWGQQPTLYRETFRMVADIIHKNTCRAAMMWAPNNGCGYPWGSTGPATTSGFCAGAAGRVNMTECDANGDGVVDSGDAFVPYYPGNDYVDWVGLSVYHQRSFEIAPPNKFIGFRPDGVTPTCISNVDTFYRLFSSNSSWYLEGDANILDATPEYADAVGAATPPRKLMAIGEAGARYSLCDNDPNTPSCLAYNGTPTELEIKQSWWTQVFGTETIRRFPRLRLVQWFDIQQPNAFEGNTGDWSLTHTPTIRNEFLRFLNSTAGGNGYWQFTPASHANVSNNMCTLYIVGTTEPPPPPIAPVAPQPPIYQWYELRANILSTNRNKCYTVVQNRTVQSLSDRVQSWQCRNSTAAAAADDNTVSTMIFTQRFRMQVVSRNATATIVSFMDNHGRCLEAAAANVSSGARIQVGPCTGGKHQQMRLSKAGNDIDVLILQHVSNRCATVLLANPMDGTNVVSSTCTRGQSQQVEIRAVPVVRR